MKTIKKIFTAAAFAAFVLAFSPVSVAGTNAPAPDYQVISTYINSQGTQMVVIKYTDGRVVHVPVAAIVPAQDMPF